MKDHILVAKARRYNRPLLNKINNDCEYDIQKGYWILKSTHEPMMISGISEKPMSKKEDLETGEDMKGE